MLLLEPGQALSSIAKHIELYAGQYGGVGSSRLAVANVIFTQDEY